MNVCISCCAFGALHLCKDQHFFLNCFSFLLRLIYNSFKTLWFSLISFFSFCFLNYGSCYSNLHPLQCFATPGSSYGSQAETQHNSTTFVHGAPWQSPSSTGPNSFSNSPNIPVEALRKHFFPDFNFFWHPLLLLPLFGVCLFVAS